MRRMAAAGAALLALAALEREAHLTQIAYEGLSLEALVKQADVIVVARPASPPRRTRKISIVLAGAKPDAEKYPPYERVLGRWQIVEVLRGDQLAPGATVEVDQAYFAMRLDVHRPTVMGCREGRTIGVHWMGLACVPLLPSMGSMMDLFDLVVVGTGAGASTPAHRCRNAGWRVAIVDELPFGGTCALRGCDPKKVLVGAAELVDWTRRMQSHGVAGEVKIEWPALMGFKRGFTDPVAPSREQGYARAGIETFHGRARFVDEQRLAVNDRVLWAKHFVIATGATPRRLGIPGEAHVVTSTDFLALERLPQRIVFVGAGYISFEFAHVARRAGAEVTIVGRAAPLGHFDRDLVERLVAHTRSLGIDVRLGSEVVAVARGTDGCDVVVRADGRDETLRTDLVVHGGGRAPNTEGLELGVARVATDEHGAVRVNDYLQSQTNPRVYAAGDVVTPAPGKMPLTPVAGYEAGVVASNLLDGNEQKRAYRAIPSVVFTIPPLALVGQTEADARRVGVDVRVETGDTSSWYSNRRIAEKTAMYKVIIDKQSDLIVGAHLLGPHAEEVINLYALAMRHQIPARELKSMQYSYPSVSSDISYMV